ncbi:hypothetical protein [Gelidibacter sp. F63206]|uniref:hypothetical protein n=1 Tax=Gelidibacter sp. F63206 TaxID=2926425 RepID=UPI001FF1963B|nr:hypothetical protein [Gelidibacter sp. F63206]MCK0114725.1 hypothetical protein [Gelidibacter sp. F63206]
MRLKEHIVAKAALVSAILGVLGVLALLYPDNDGINFLIPFYMIFFGLAILLGGISLLIKRNTLAWIAFLIGCFFALAFMMLIFLLKDMCILC